VVTLGRPDQVICPVRAVLRHMVVRNAGKAPFFRIEGAVDLTRKGFIVRIQESL